MNKHLFFLKKFKRRYFSFSAKKLWLFLEKYIVFLKNEKTTILLFADFQALFLQKREQAEGMGRILISPFAALAFSAGEALAPLQVGRARVCIVFLRQKLKPCFDVTAIRHKARYLRHVNIWYSTSGHRRTRCQSCF
ncbi:MAG: hypothetical protein ACK4NS_02995 [Saprospiraceae bacterium]